MCIGKNHVLCSLDDPESQFSWASRPEPSRFAISLRILDRNGGRASLTSEGMGTMYPWAFSFGFKLSRPKLSRLLYSRPCGPHFLSPSVSLLRFSFVSLLIGRS